MLVSIIITVLGIIGIITGAIMMIIGSKLRYDYNDIRGIGLIVLFISILITFFILLITVCSFTDDLQAIRTLEMKMENPTQSFGGIITEFEIRDVIKMKAQLDTYGMFSHYYIFKDRINTLYANIK